MSNELQTRPITCIPFKKLAHIDTLRIEQIVITVDKNHDIGAWCYRHRAKRSTNGRGKAVALSSFDRTRPSKLKSVIECLYDEISHLSKAAQGDHLYSLLRFLNWCDENNFNDVLTDQSSTRNAYKAYSNILRDRCARGKIDLRTAGKHQAYILKLFQALYNDILFGDGIRIIKSIKAKFNITPAQDESDQAKILAWCQSIFDGFSDFTLEEQAFPFQLAIPEHKDWQINHLWVFPSTTMIMTPDTLAIRNTLNRGQWVYDYANGKLNTQEPIKDYYKDYKKPGDGAEVALRNANIIISQANSDLRHLQRKRLAKTALLAFLHLFFAYSGQNSTPVQLMRWPEDYEVGAERQGFRLIKNRGHKGEILFEIQSTFLPLFKKYLQLREWLLKDTIKTDLLFFSLGTRNDKTPRILSSPTEHFKAKLKSIGINLPAFGARQFRANKNDFANSHADLATAAKAANHSVDTHKKSYMGGTESKHAAELSGFFSAIVKSATENHDSDKQTGLGHCENPGQPNSLPTHTSIPPKCGQPEGCLFCKHFFVHADEEDIRKLASGRYVIQKTRHLADSPEHFENLFNPVFERIAGLLNEITERSDKLKQLVNRVVIEVDEEEYLSDFWASELRYLIDLDLVNE